MGPRPGYDADEFVTATTDGDPSAVTYLVGEVVQLHVSESLAVDAQ
jgi:hypothetical protein